MALRPERMDIGIDWDVTRNLFSYGGKLFLSGFIVFIIFNFDNYVIGSVMGASTLGYYALAFKWGAFMPSVLSSVILSVLFPTYVKLKSDIQNLRMAYLKTMEYVSFAGIFANLTLFFVSESFVVHVLGGGSEKWLPALPTLKIMCFYGIARLLLEPVGNVILAVGKPQLFLRATIIAAGIEVLFIYLALRTFNIEGVAVVVTIAYVAQYPIYLLFLRQELQLTIWNLIHSVQAAVISALCIVPLQVAISILNLSNSLRGLVFHVFILATVYVLVYGLITKWEIYAELIGLTRSLVRNK